MQGTVWGFPILLPQYPLRTGMTVSLARMMAPRIAVATSLEHLTPKPTCPSWSPMATKAWKRKVNYNLNNNTFPKLFKCNMSNAIYHRNLNKRIYLPWIWFFDQPVSVSAQAWFSKLHPSEMVQGNNQWSQTPTNYIIKKENIT